MAVDFKQVSQSVADDITPSLHDLKKRRPVWEPDTRCVPIHREILADLETPVSAYLKISEGLTRPGFILESVEGGIRIARYSFIGADFMEAVVMKGGLVTIHGGTETRSERYADPLTALGSVLEGYRSELDSTLPRFTGGAVGYLSYDAIHRFEPRVPLAIGAGLDLPEARFHIADSLVVFDHLERTMIVIAHVRVGPGTDLDASYAHAADQIDRLTSKLLAPVPTYEMRRHDEQPTVVDRFRSNTTPERYFEMVDRAKEYIREGDIFQVVPSQRVDIRTDAAPFTMYRALRMVNPSPYMFYLDFGEHQIVGASPELLVRLEDRIVTNHPIAGTRPRGQSPAEDEQNAVDLISDEKERAEHIMLVDLGRNDVGRVSAPGTVHVPELMEIEKFSHVMHIVSHVEGELRRDLTGLDALRSCFPAGTVSGAPKIRAMEIISEMETDRRGVYAGAVGYFDFAGGMDTCIALRTMVVRDGIASLQAGGGVVADSVPETEYAESMHKMRALVRAIERAERIETSQTLASGGLDPS